MSIENYSVEEINRILSVTPWMSKIKAVRDITGGAGGMSSGVFEVSMAGSDLRLALKVMDEDSFKGYSAVDYESPQSIALEKQENWKKLTNVLAGTEINMNNELSSLRNSYFVPAYKTYNGEEIKFILMPYYDTLVSYDGDPEDTAVHVIEDICQALKVLHYDDSKIDGNKLGILFHCDIKPQNIFYESQGGFTQFKLGDFGSLCHKGDKCSIYTKGYCAPEVMRGEKLLQPSIDIFSLGMVAYWCVCKGNDNLTYEMWEKRLKGEINPKPDSCSNYLWSIIRAATECDPECRIATVDQMLAKLEEISRRKTDELQESSKNKGVMIGGSVAAVAVMAYHLLKPMFQQTDDLTKQKIRYESIGSWYKGEVKANQPTGHGTYHFSDGREISGEWQQEKDAIYKLFGDFTTGKYAGTVCDGRICGYGIIEAEEYWTYEGELYDNVPSGKGIFTYLYLDKKYAVKGKWKWIEDMRMPDKISLYTGMICNGKPCGIGKMVTDGKGSFLGILHDYDFKWGVYKETSGECCAGTWVFSNNVYDIHGFGVQRLPDGSRYRGEFHMGKRNGNGTMEYPDGSRYEGEWVNDKRVGSGTFTDVQGHAKSGLWVEDKIFIELPSSPQ